MEIISKENGAKLTGKIDINPSYLRRKLRISITNLSRIFHYCDTSMKLSCNLSEKLWHFSVPKLIDLKDNYTKDLQVTGKKPSNHKEVEEEVDINILKVNSESPQKAAPEKEQRKRKKTSSSRKVFYSEEFEMFWKEYPRRVGKGNAWKAWKSSGIDNGMVEKVMDAVILFSESQKGKEEQYIPHPSTWINGRRWEDEKMDTKKLDTWETPL